jgi:flagellar biosynthesis chaperone FliJ
MKPLRSLLRPIRALRPTKPPATPQHCADVLRACEEAASRMKSTSDELAACWSALRGEISAGVTGTDLLRRRAWCNVLELRLKEHAHALEEARRGIDAVWRAMTRSDREYGKARKPSHVEVLRKKIEMEANWSLIAAAMEGRAAQGPHATER